MLISEPNHRSPNHRSAVFAREHRRLENLPARVGERVKGRACQRAPQRSYIPQSTDRHRSTPRPMPYTDEQKDQALHLYRQGYSCRAAAEEVGIGFRTVAAWVRQAGLSRSRTEHSAHQRRRSSQAKAQAKAAQQQARREAQARRAQAHRARLRQARTLRGEGLSYREIGERLGRCRQTIARWLRE